MPKQPFSRSIEAIILASEQDRWERNLTYQVYDVSLVSMPYNCHLVTTVLNTRQRSLFAVETSIYRTMDNGVTVRERQVSGPDPFELRRNEVI